MSQTFIEAEIGNLENNHDLLFDTAKISNAVKTLQYSVRRTPISGKLLSVVNTLALCLEKYLDVPIAVVLPPKRAKGAH